MVDLSVREIEEIHKIVVERFKISSGIINKGNLSAIVERPNLMFEGKEFYRHPFSKASSLLEGIIRWHPFADGNKRTALLTMVYYLKLSGYGVALPLSSVRYTVQIAKNKKTDEKSTQKLIKETSKWIEKYAGKNKNEMSGKIFLYLYLPYKFLGFLYRIGFKNYVIRKFSIWMAFDIYPEYAKEAGDIINFINDTLASSFRIFDDS